MSEASTEPSQAQESKSIRVDPEVHKRLQRIVDTTGCKSLSDAVAFLLDPTVVHVNVTREQRQKWDAYASENGMRTSEFVIARVEAACQYGVDPGAVRRIHDMVYALTKAAGIIPEQLSTPGSHRQVITNK